MASVGGIRSEQQSLQACALSAVPVVPWHRLHSALQHWQRAWHWALVDMDREQAAVGLRRNHVQKEVKIRLLKL